MTATAKKLVTIYVEGSPHARPWRQAGRRARSGRQAGQGQRRDGVQCFVDWSVVIPTSRAWSRRGMPSHSTATILLFGTFRTWTRPGRSRGGAPTPTSTCCRVARPRRRTGHPRGLWPPLASRTRRSRSPRRNRTAATRPAGIHASSGLDGRTSRCRRASAAPHISRSTASALRPAAAELATPCTRRYFRGVMPNPCVRGSRAKNASHHRFPAAANSSSEITVPFGRRTSSVSNQTHRSK